ncbi:MULTISPECIES: DMT family transporter [unclassified Colwellia]|jgi:drug/metabolite transporter (DMT)-like permease|uniref:DMT family transporter n=1 Tax=unclassified Colwellia TaxID=196834 RepID=UPI0015F6F8D0|nr:MULTISPECIES: DMT family transporter [unclassified Colwellia]MBA6338236.1 EamA family transporter [Colwellia sp. BRX8-7]MBA6357038.1 EamA family transporter [Colwellia sp. BRX8-3]MBA6360653.1 EamA family transporter [Colwellia sp. BRX8-6]MBA6369003.1 EamA family transporter [Colwellia sp. BRX8-5]MBA6374878.1 EamA family transporter [Colwellia sp. BRX8-2]
MPSHKQSLFSLHSAVLLFAISGLFAKWLNMPASHIVFGRAAFAAATIALFVLLIRKQSLKVEKSLLLPLAFTGLVLAFHWGSFFYAIQVSSVAIGLITFATFPVFVSFLEPMLFKEKFHYKALLQALLTVVGILFILPLDHLSAGDIDGVIWGMTSAMSFALLTLLNRKFVAKTSAKKVAFYQNACATVCLLPLMFLYPITISYQQLSVLIILGVLFTAVAHTLFNHSLKVVKAQTASIAVSLEPIYGSIAAYFLLGEQITLMMVIGGSIVIFTNLWASKTNS